MLKPNESPRREIVGGYNLVICLVLDGKPCRILCWATKIRKVRPLCLLRWAAINLHLRSAHDSFFLIIICFSRSLKDKISASLFFAFFLFKHRPSKSTKCHLNLDLVNEQICLFFRRIIRPVLGLEPLEIFATLSKRSQRVNSRTKTSEKANSSSPVSPDGTEETPSAERQVIYIPPFYTCPVDPHQKRWFTRSMDHKILGKSTRNPQHESTTC